MYTNKIYIYIYIYNGQLIDRACKNIIKIFIDFWFDIDTETNSKVVDFLDITFNLNNGIHELYKKPNNTLLYINKSSNHPQQIINKLPRIISDRLSRISSNMKVFNTSKREYEEALKCSGYSNINLPFQQSSTSHVKWQHHCNIIWFNCLIVMQSLQMLQRNTFNREICFFHLQTSSIKFSKGIMWR